MRRIPEHTEAHLLSPHPEQPEDVHRLVGPAKLLCWQIVPCSTWSLGTVLMCTCLFFWLELGG